MRKLEKEITEESHANSETGRTIQLLDRLRLAIKHIVTSIISPRRIPKELYTALQNADVDGKMEIVEQLIYGRQGDFVMMCLQSFPEIDPSIVIRKLVTKGQSPAVILNQFRIRELDQETSAMIDREYYRIAPLIFPIR